MGPRGQEPSLADDEARLVELAVGLHAALVEAIPSWLERLAAERLGRSLAEDERARVAAVAEQLADRLSAPLERVLTADVDAGAGTPLAVVRGVAGEVADLLDGLGVPAPPRDPFGRTRFPDDRHEVGPASFADIHPALHEPGISWGAARAHVHLRRRRERGT